MDPSPAVGAFCEPCTLLEDRAGDAPHQCCRAPFCPASDTTHFDARHRTCAFCPGVGDNHDISCLSAANPFGMTA